MIWIILKNKLKINTKNYTHESDPQEEFIIQFYST